MALTGKTRQYNIFLDINCFLQYLYAFWFYGRIFDRLNEFLIIPGESPSQGRCPCSLGCPCACSGHHFGSRKDLFLPSSADPHQDYQRMHWNLGQLHHPSYNPCFYWGFFYSFHEVPLVSTCVEPNMTIMISIFISYLLAI